MALKPITFIFAALAASPALAAGHSESETQKNTSYYGFGFVGATELQNPTFEGSVGGAPQSVETFFEGREINLGFGVGRSFRHNLRGEVELSYSSSEISNTNFSGNGPAQEPATGDISTTRVLANVYRDFDSGNVFTPYVGAGLGLASTDLGVSYGPGVSLDDKDTSLSAQIIVGGAFEISEQVSFISDLRFTRDFDVDTQRLAPTGALTGVVSDDVDNVSLNVGLRFAF